MEQGVCEKNVNPVIVNCWEIYIPGYNETHEFS